MRERLNISPGTPLISSQMGEVQWYAYLGSPPPVIRRRAVLSQGHVPRAAAAVPKFIREMQVTLGTAPNVDISQMTTIPGDVQVGLSLDILGPRSPAAVSAPSVTEEMQQEMRALASQVAGSKGDEPLKSLARLNPPELHHQVHQEVKRYQSTGVVKAQEKTLESEAKSPDLSPAVFKALPSQRQVAIVVWEHIWTDNWEVGATPSRVTRPTEASARRSQAGSEIAVTFLHDLTEQDTTFYQYDKSQLGPFRRKKESTGPVVRDVTPSAWALATSRSSPSLETRMVLGRQVRETAMATPRSSLGRSLGRGQKEIEEVLEHKGSTLQCCNLLWDSWSVTQPVAKAAPTLDRQFKLSIVLHSATVEKISGPGLVQDQRPYITIRINDKLKVAPQVLLKLCFPVETELGDWCSDKEQWCFREVITLEVVPTDEIFVAVSSSTKYDFWLASVQLTNTKIGEACFPVFSVMPRLKPEDRDENGIVFSSPIIPFDVREDGVTTARTYLSFETMQAPMTSRQHRPSEGGCCEISRKEANPSRSATPALRSRRKDFKAPVPQTIPPGARPRTLGGQLLHTKDPKIIAEFKVPKETQRYQDYPCGRRSPRARYSATIKEWERPQEMILREPVMLGKVARIDWEARCQKAK
ncbi:unnamed protein product [Cladocopium goreaui]|uniref:Uncharacterized protein n=1 Tax=Cladocopium goreaui TaxID=2562237 RepID=A0A9P1DRK2_9DINO|nr:unnamed protein product [Cladocopium goreaui]